MTAGETGGVGTVAPTRVVADDDGIGRMTAACTIPAMPAREQVVVITEEPRQHPPKTWSRLRSKVTRTTPASTVTCSTR